VLFIAEVFGHLRTPCSPCCSTPRARRTSTGFSTIRWSRLLAHDARRSTQLVATLSAYFGNAGNVTRTSAALHVHMNTLLKRLDRVDSVLGKVGVLPTRPCNSR
jgi:sugar diacid utilization regulator